MLTISSIPEALAELEIRTGRAWTDSEIFDLATNCDIELHAAPPITARITIQKFIVGEGLVEKFRSPPGHALLAVLFPWQVAQLWMSGETKTSHPSKHDEMEDEYQWFTEPVRITREQVRIKAATLQKMFAVWSQAQAGRWIEDTTKPGDMRYQNCPEWMFPAEEFVPVQTAATTEPVVTEGVSGGEVTAPNWRMQIQAEAYELWIRFRAKGCNPSVYSICDDMAVWCIRKNIKGGKGKNPRAGTIRNTVLGAGHWTPPPHSVEQAKKYVEQIARTAQT